MHQSQEDRRATVLRRLRHREFSGFRYTPQDALVAHAPVPGGPAPPVRARLMLPLEHRLYPMESGFLVRWPFQEEDFDLDHFRVEPGGWDHEHCEACQATIATGDECWYTTGDTTHFLCGSCFDRLGDTDQA